MRKIIISLLIIIGVILTGWLLKDVTIKNNYAENDRFITIEDEGYFKIVYDVETKVEYAVSYGQYNKRNNHTASRQRWKTAIIWRGVKQMQTADKIKIELKDIKKLQHLYIDIFTEEDEDYPDGRIISNKEKAVQRILDKITDTRFNQSKFNSEGVKIWQIYLYI